jgi:phosphoribosylformylglycinamidine cyclo-ligase
MTHKSYSESYKAAGVDVTAGYEAVRLMKSHVDRTKTEGAIDSIGGFGGMFMPDLSGMKQPVFVSGTDGVGTKLKLAFLMDKHDTIGIDAVAMCANDIICCGAKPLFFLDYIACGKNKPEKIAEIVKGIADGCVQAGCALIGGETAEMPGFYPEDEYDIAGFCCGVVDKEDILDKSSVEVGDILIGLASTGVHSNGFSLVRKVFDITSKHVLETMVEEEGKTLGELLLAPTAIYVKPILELLKTIRPKSVSHITGGGFYENIPRALPDNLTAKINKSTFDQPYIFTLLQEKGHISERDMYNTFNMGIGMVLVVSPKDADKAVTLLESQGVKAYCIGEVIKGDEGVVIL